MPYFVASPDEDDVGWCPHNSNTETAKARQLAAAGVSESVHDPPFLSLLPAYVQCLIPPQVVMTIYVYFRDGHRESFEIAPSLVTPTTLCAIAQAARGVLSICPAKYGCRQFVSPEWEGGAR